MAFKDFTFKQKWYFIKQDIASYSMSTLLYVVLCLIKNFSWGSILYGLFECLVFYVPFWFIRICFDDTYHSDNWRHCKKWTRIMLCTGVFVMWILPIPYSVWKSVVVAFVCCLILYLVAIETNEKKFYYKRNQELEKQVEELLAQSVDPQDKLINMCRTLNISNRDTNIAVKYYIEKWKPKQIWQWLCENEWNMEYDSVYKIINRLNKKLK